MRDAQVRALHVEQGHTKHLAVLDLIKSFPENEVPLKSTKKWPRYNQMKSKSYGKPCTTDMAKKSKKTRILNIQISKPIIYFTYL